MNIRRSTILILALLPPFGASAAGSAVTLLPVTQSDIDYVVKKRTALGIPDDPQLRGDIRNELVDQALLARQAEKVALEQTPDVKAQLDLSRLAILSKAYLDRHFKDHPVTDEAIRQEYERRRTSGEILEYNIRQIVVKSDAKARELIKALKAGADFAKLAGEHSHDPGADHHGGQIGWFRPDIFVDENFAEAVTRLKKGQIAEEPVRTRFGWNIIKLEDGPRAVGNAPAYENTNVKLQGVLREKAERKVVDKLLADLKARSHIVAGLGPAASSR